MVIRLPADKETVAAALEVVLRGGTYEQAGALVGLRPQVVHIYARRAGINRGALRKARRQDLARQALSALAKGQTTTAVAAAVGVSPSTLINWRKAQPAVVSRQPKARVGALCLAQREEIRVGLSSGRSVSVIAAAIGVHRSTVWREVRANGGPGAYRAHLAQLRATRAARRPKPTWTVARPELWEAVAGELRTKKWSPEQISARLRRQHPDEPAWWVSPEAIYRAVFIQAKPTLRDELAKCLRSGRAARRPHGRSSPGGSIRGMVNISERPAEVEDRAVPGHWEGDLIVGKGGHSAVATLVERSTRFGMLVRLTDKTAEHVAQRLAEHIKVLPVCLAQSLTWDQGTEMAAHRAFSLASEVDVYFCDPHSPWQRGTNENWNGLVRQFLPKGTDLSVHSQAELDHIAYLLNGRPRKTLGWDTPAERFAELVALTG